MTMENRSSITRFSFFRVCDKELEKRSTTAGSVSITKMLCHAVFLGLLAIYGMGGTAHEV